MLLLILPDQKSSVSPCYQIRKLMSFSMWLDQIFGWSWYDQIRYLVSVSETRLDITFWAVWWLTWPYWELPDLFSGLIDGDKISDLVIWRASRSLVWSHCPPPDTYRVNNRNADGLRGHLAHCDVTVMIPMVISGSHICFFLISWRCRRLSSRVGCHPCALEKLN